MIGSYCKGARFYAPWSRCIPNCLEGVLGNPPSMGGYTKKVSERRYEEGMISSQLLYACLEDAERE